MMSSGPVRSSKPRMTFGSFDDISSASTASLAGLQRAYCNLVISSRAWGESLLSLPKRWLSTQVYGTDDEDFQNVQLAKLPVPELEATMESYLEFAAVVVSQQQLEHTRGLARGFMEELGPRLQAQLQDRQAEMENWVRVT